MKDKIKVIIWSLAVFFLPLVALAQAPIKDAAEGFRDLDANRIVSIFLSIANWFLALLGIIAVLVALYSAFIFITRGGESEDERNKAKQTLIYAVIGVAVAIVAFGIVSFTQSLLGSPTGNPGGLNDDGLKQITLSIK